MTRDELIALTQEILAGLATLSEEELSRKLDLLQQHVPHPAVSDLIFYPPDGKFKTDYSQIPEPTPAEIVDRALAYRPIITPPPQE